MYVKTIWIDDVTPVSAEKMNNIENQVESNSQSLILGSGESTMTADLPSRGGSSPNYVYYMVTVNIPIPDTVQEAVIILAGCTMHLFRCLPYAISYSKSDSNGILYGPRIVAVDKGYGATVVASTPPSVVGTGGAIFGSTTVFISDAYLSGGNIVLKVCTEGTTALTDKSQSFTYITRG